jgi:hypothetical protein
VAAAPSLIALIQQGFIRPAARSDDPLYLVYELTDDAPDHVPNPELALRSTDALLGLLRSFREIDECAFEGDRDDKAG